MPTHTPRPPANAPPWRLQRWLDYGEITNFNEQPYPMTAEDHEQFRFPYWFNYFWTELKNHRIEDWLPLYRRVFEPDGTVRQAFADSSSMNKKAFLEELLAAGFEEFPGRLRKNPAALLAGSSLTNEADEVLGIAFRGDSRPADLIQAHGGSLAKADSRRVAMKMNAAWNPFSYPDLRENMYYRKGSDDNCLMTVVSVMMDALGATKFPLIEEMKVEDKKQAIVWINGQSTRMTATRCTVYALKLNGWGYDTKARQIETAQARRVGAPYGGNDPTKGEKAVRGVVWAQHLAQIRVVRIHHGGNGNDGHTAFIESVRELQNDVGMMLMLESREALASYRAAMARYFQERLQVYQPTAGQQPPRITRYAGIVGEPSRWNGAAPALPYLTWADGAATWQGV